MAHAKRYLFTEDEQFLANYNQALAHPARQRVMSLLRKHKHLCFEDILSKMPLAKSTIQLHIRTLQRVHLIVVAGNHSGEAGYTINYEAYNEAKQLLLRFWQLG